MPEVPPVEISTVIVALTVGASGLTIFMVVWLTGQQRVSPRPTRMIAIPATVAALLVGAVVLLPRSVQEGVSAIGEIGRGAPRTAAAAEVAPDPPRPDEVGDRGRPEQERASDLAPSVAGVVAPATAPSTGGPSVEGGDGNGAEPSSSPAEPSDSPSVPDDASSSGDHGPPAGKGPPEDPGPPANPGPPAHAGPPR
jgi:hypothetical protein